LKNLKINDMKRIITLSILLVSTALSAQILNPATWQCLVSNKKIHKGDIVELIFTVKLDANWHLFSHIQAYELGPLPTTFEFEPHNSYKLMGDMVAIGSIKQYDSIFDVSVNYFENRAEFRQKIKLLSENPNISGTYEYQVCSLIDGKCIMGSDDFEFQLQTLK